MENGDAQAQLAQNAPHAQAANDLQQQINYLQQQLLGQQHMFHQQNQFLAFQQYRSI